MSVPFSNLSRYGIQELFTVGCDISYGLQESAIGTSGGAHPMFQGLRTALYHADELEKATAWYSSVLGFEPYFNEPYYVGFNVGGYELGLVPSTDDAPGGAAGVAVYWGVDDAEETMKRLLSLGATERNNVQDVGDGIQVGSVLDPFGNILGFIKNPHFSLPDSQ